jgi:hypothetical protein
VSSLYFGGFGPLEVGFEGVGFHVVPGDVYKVGFGLFVSVDQVALHLALLSGTIFVLVVHST